MLSTLSPDVLCKACTYKKRKSDCYTQAEWRESSNGKECNPSTNFVPTFYGPVMISKKHLDPNADPDDRVLTPMMWGIIPRWHKGPPTQHKISTNNCRIERITESRLYKDPLNKGRRCVVLCEGFYEWKKPKSKGGIKQPYIIYFPQPEGQSMFESETWTDRLDELWSKEDGWKGPKPLTMAGLFDIWKSPEDDSIIYSYSIITMDSSSAFAWIHERMPAILETEDDVRDWLDYTRVPAEQALAKLKASSILTFHPVSTDVNNAKNKGNHLTKPIDLNKPKKLSGSGKFMTNWLSQGSPVKAEKSESSPKEGVKRHSSTKDLVQGTSAKKVKEDEATN